MCVFVCVCVCVCPRVPVRSRFASRSIMIAVSLMHVYACGGCQLFGLASRWLQRVTFAMPLAERGGHKEDAHERAILT